MSHSVDYVNGTAVCSPVTGDDFFDRTHELREFMGLVDRGAHVMVTAPRRIGKTSLLLEAGSRLADRFVVLFVDVQACTDETEAVLKLAMVARAHRDVGQRIYDGFRNVLASALSRLDELSVAEISAKLREGIAPDWRSKADEILDRLAAIGKPIVVSFDEFPVLVSSLLCGDDHQMTRERVARARVFLSWMREATIRYRGTIRFVISGSIGLEPLLTRAGISETVTTFTPLAIEAWDRHTALAFIVDRARRHNLTFTDGAADRLLHKLQYFIPNHVAMFIRFVEADARRRDSTACSVEDIDRIYDHDVLSVHGHVDMATYEDRLKRVVAPEMLRASLELLTEAAVVGRLSPNAAMSILHGHGFEGDDATDNLRFLLAVFVHDGYLKAAGNDYVFVSHLLRDWWLHRFKFGYVPVAERPRGAR
jgi:hypothetical protein